MNSERKCLQKVILASDVYISCLQHAFSTEKEEIMGLLIGQVDERKAISYISAYIILHRSDKQPDRVEISPEQLSTASGYAEELERKLKKPMRVIGWYHSHPHITVWPSHVDVRTQAMYQMMDPFFIGLIFSVFQNKPNNNQIQLTCFQSMPSGSEYKRREVELVIESSPLHSYNYTSMTNLPKILSQEEIQSHKGDGDDGTDDGDDADAIKEDKLAILHNDAFKTVALVHMVSKVAGPLYEAMEDRLAAVTRRIEALKSYKNRLS